MSTKPTIAALLSAYYASPNYRRLAPATRRNYDRALALLKPHHDLLVAELKSSLLRRQRDAMSDRPGMANQFVKATSAVLGWAIETEAREWGLEHNAARAVKALPLGSWEQWPDEAIARFEAALPTLRRDVRVGFTLLLHTGQRRGDVLRMRWSHVKPLAYGGLGAIEVVQEKAGPGAEKLLVPVHPILRAMLEAERGAAEGDYLVHGAGGHPYHNATVYGRDRQSPFYAAMRAAQARVLEGDHYPLHGLRKAACARMAEAGCTPHQIMAVTGHKSLAMVDLYTRNAAQRVGAQAAMTKLIARGT